MQDVESDVLQHSSTFHNNATKSDPTEVHLL